MQFLIFCSVLLWAIVNAQDYCSVCIDHTMCRFGDNTGRSCGKSSEGGVTNSEIQTILKLHNDYRRKVAVGKETQGTPGPQPMAANMQTLVWDRKLAEVAQRWADQCTFKHDKCRDDTRFSVGQNIYYSSGLIITNWTRAVEAWYQEVKHVNSSQINSFDYQSETAHYSQFVWAKTRYVGCARRKYSGNYRPRNSRALEYVLGEARGRNDSNADGTEANYFGGKIRKSDLMAGMRGAITSKNITTYVINDRPQARQSWLGFFGGATFDPNGAEGAITKPSANDQKPKPAASNVNVVAKPTYVYNYNVRPQMIVPAITYPVYRPYYPTYTQYMTYEQTYEAANARKTKAPSNDSSDESSEESSSEDSFEEMDRNIVVPSSLQFKSWTNEGWKMIDYDLSTDQIYICNYGPSGNFIDQPIYITGPPCSKCPSGTKCRNGLCD